MTIDTWHGRPLDELTREELIAALQEFGVFHQDLVAMQQNYIAYLTDLQTPPLVLWLRRVFGKAVS